MNELKVIEEWAFRHGDWLPGYEFGMKAEDKRIAQDVWDAYITRLQLARVFDAFKANELHGLVAKRFAVRGAPAVPRYMNCFQFNASKRGGRG